ncbi:ribonuclease H-like YkuK family protein [Priestia taiwanensis]|uniref:ribonuclease H-like YkuK family protein n=1 Tax=Priestia taiwanensis TaxID=1347902 RepID=UPI003570E8B4
MQRGGQIVSDEMFYNLSMCNMSFEDVFGQICTFMKKDPRQNYRLSIGTDSKVHTRFTRFITAIHIHRIGNGAWGCLRPIVIKREVMSLREKIHLETMYSQEIAYLFTPERTSELIEIIYPYKKEGGNFTMEIHLDIGQYGLTREFIQEATSRITAMGITAKIKPDAYAASSYANRYTR